MRLIPLLVLVCVNANSVCAQSTLTEKLRKQEKSKGTVIITQSEQIEQIINNTVPNHTQQHTGNKDNCCRTHPFDKQTVGRHKIKHQKGNLRYPWKT